MVKSAEISPCRRTNDAVCRTIFSYEYLFEAAISNRAVKRLGESVRWADLTIRLIVKTNSMSVKNQCIVNQYNIFLSPFSVKCVIKLALV